MWEKLWAESPGKVWVWLCAGHPRSARYDSGRQNKVIGGMQDASSWDAGEPGCPRSCLREPRGWRNSGAFELVVAITSQNKEFGLNQTCEIFAGGKVNGLMCFSHFVLSYSLYFLSFGGKSCF